MKFYHCINKSNKGGITIAYEVISHKKGKTLQFAIAQCSKKDNYCKKTGVTIASRKFKETPFSMVVKGSEKAIKQRVQHNLHALCFYFNKLQN